MRTVVGIYTGQGLAEPLKRVFQEVLPDVRLVNLIDDGLIHDVVRAGGVTPAIRRRLLGYYQQGAEMGADVIFNTCSSVGEVADLARPFVSVPIVKIDDLMTEEAVRRYARIGVLATLPTTLQPTARLLQRQAERLNRQVHLTDGLAAGAFDALVGGRPEEHDRLLFETAARVAEEVDVLVLAQGSMARVENALVQATGKPVLSSPRHGALAIRRLLESGTEQLGEER